MAEQGPFGAGVFPPPPPAAAPVPPPLPRPLPVPPGSLPPVPAAPRPRSRRGRPLFIAVVVLALAERAGREVVTRAVGDRYGGVGVLAVVAAAVAVAVLWRVVQRHRVVRRGGVEFTPDQVARQIAASELGPPAFREDGSVLGASLFAVNQHAKLLEVETAYALFGSDGRPLGTVRQVGQSRAKALVRLTTGFDQFFTHHLDVAGVDGRTVLRLTRPRKLLLSRVHVFDAHDRYLGGLRQRNVFGRIRFSLSAPGGVPLGELRAGDIRAWDFHVHDDLGREVAVVVKSWEGWAHAALTRADRYVVRVHAPLPHPLRQLVLAAALTVDLALKQDVRWLG